LAANTWLLEHLMSHGYRVVSWTPFKKRFDAWMLAGVAVYLLSFVLVASLIPPAGESFTPLQTLIRATGTLAFLLLTFLLCIGPLARLTPRFKPLLYNRRHLGVATFLVALVHGVLVVVWYHGFGVLNPIVSLLVSNPRYDSLAGFPFESLGLVALLLLFLLAATSHDFWNANLGPGLWKGIHMSVYAAYALLLGHVALGALQTEVHALYFAALVAAALAVAGLQVYTARFASGDPARPEPGPQGWLRVGLALDIPDNRAIVVEPPGAERIAVFRFDGKVAAVSNVCRHQGGPLGEGRVIDGCITCPWHGYQYRPEDGCSPAPFTERVATYATRVTHGVVFVQSRPLKPGTPIEPSVIEPAKDLQHGQA
jgi:nitrite reductase/ring-hydroxylating ferredoxin subunit/DMSO/TMAO reductase YedYZ heme-binding membrane subunit